jgi:hypothetical protein
MLLKEFKQHLLLHLMIVVIQYVPVQYIEKEEEYLEMFD